MEKITLRYEAEPRFDLAELTERLSKIGKSLVFDYWVGDIALLGSGVGQTPKEMARTLAHEVWRTRGLSVRVCAFPDDLGAEAYLELKLA